MPKPRRSDPVRHPSSIISHSRSGGSVLIYSLLIMSSILAIGIGMNAVFLKNLQGVRAARDSTMALYAADAGTELCLYEARSGRDDDIMLVQGSGLVITNLADNSDITADCSALGSGSFDFRATGTFRGSSRALEIGQQ